ncbi:hypothetical protein FBEOM_6933 [Fusarium beomiforme]|uniref:Uncharacterized protein n=1 Tax=Fusarium beomiforme TaxID=44412 RepID=A0A9P5DXI8_9HYPO|nr:hypothetical protein FBEOM_6933 [Fusarium beomiforme]
MIPVADSWKLELFKTKPRTTVPIDSEELPRQVIGPDTYSTLENTGLVEKQSNLSQRMSGDGVIMELTNHGTSKGMELFAKPAQQWVSVLETNLKDNMAALASSLSTKLILPAGNVFEFKSLNTDWDGHVYSLITYKTPTSLSHI